MAIPSFIASSSAGAIDGGDITLAMPTGTATGDVTIVIAGGRGSGGTNLNEVPVGSALWTVLGTSDDTIGKSRVFSLIHGATPETQIVIKGSGNVANAASAIAQTFRNPNSSQLLDVTIASVQANATDPDPPSITTVSNNCKIVVAATSEANEPTITVPTGYSNLTQVNTVDTNRLSAAMASKDLATAGAENPAAFTSWATGRSHAWTIALKEASSGSTYNESVSESVSLSDANNTALAAVGAMSEALALADTSTGLGVFGKAMSESLTLVDTPAVTGTFGHSTSEALALADTSTGLGIFTKAMSESVTLVDALTGGILSTGIMSESISLSDTSTTVKTSVGNMSEVLALSETESTSMVSVGAMSEALALSETEIASMVAVGARTEALALVDVVSSTLTPTGLKRAFVMGIIG